MIMKYTEFPLSTTQPSALHVNDLIEFARPEANRKKLRWVSFPNSRGFCQGDPITVSQSCSESWSADFYFKEQTIICQLAVGLGASQVALMVKNLPANAGDIRDVVWPLGQEDPLEEGMAAHSSTLAWRIPWTEDPGGLQSIASKSWTQLKWVSMHTWPLNPFLLIYLRQTWASGPWEWTFPKQHGDTTHSYNWGGYSERRKNKKKTTDPFSP